MNKIFSMISMKEGSGPFKLQCYHGTYLVDSILTSSLNTRLMQMIQDILYHFHFAFS